MALSSLFYGMEAYLDGDVEINNNISTPEDDEAMADQSAEVASDLADAQNDDKDTEIATTMMLRAHKLYNHVKTYGIDKTFLSIYNSNGELDRMCNMKFPSCEAFNEVGNNYDRYSTAFLAAMEAEGETWWQFIKRKAREIWEWIKEKANKIWEAIKGFFDFLTRRWHRLVDYFKKNKDVDIDDEAAKETADDLAEATTEAKQNDSDVKKDGDEVIKEADTVVKAVDAAESAKTPEEKKDAAQNLEAAVDRIETAVKKCGDNLERIKANRKKRKASRRQQNATRDTIRAKEAAEAARRNISIEQVQKEKEERKANSAKSNHTRVEPVTRTPRESLNVFNLKQKLYLYAAQRDSLLRNPADTEIANNLKKRIKELLDFIESTEEKDISSEDKYLYGLCLKAVNRLKTLNDKLAEYSNETAQTDKDLQQHIVNLLKNDRERQLSRQIKKIKPTWGGEESFSYDSVTPDNYYYSGFDEFWRQNEQEYSYTRKSHFWAQRLSIYRSSRRNNQTNYQR